jgi:tetratricopeptide (TPR) repeat protein
VSLICNLGILAGNRYSSSVKDIKLLPKITRSDLLSMKDVLSRASFFDPLEARYHFAVANMEVSLSDMQNALLHYKKAVRLNPVSSEYLQRTGLLLAEMKKYEAADKFLYAGIIYDAGNPVRYKQYARWLLSAGRKADGLNIIRTAISLEPRKTRDYITLMVINNIRDEEIPGALPEKVMPHLLFAEYLYKIGKDAGADEEYRTSLQYVRNEDSADPSYFYAVYGYFMKKGLHDDALNVMRKAVEYLPHDAGIRLTAAALYEKMGITYRAIEEYRGALIIDPKNENVRKRLDILLSKTKGHGNE